MHVYETLNVFQSAYSLQVQLMVLLLLRSKINSTFLYNADVPATVPANTDHFNETNVMETESTCSLATNVAVRSGSRTSLSYNVHNYQTTTRKE